MQAVMPPAHGARTEFVIQTDEIEA